MSETSSFKQLTTENWLDADPTGAIFGELNRVTGEYRAMTAHRWAEQFLAVQLHSSVPSDVCELWQVARGVFLYGWFYYPLYMLGEEQLHRVADAAILHRYRQLGGPMSRGRAPSFDHRLRWLIDNGHIPGSLEPRWAAIRQLRNLGSHSEFQGLQIPSAALSTLRLTTEEINALFS